MFSSGHCPNYPSPRFGHLVQLFLNAKNVDLSDTRKCWMRGGRQKNSSAAVQNICICEERHKKYSWWKVPEIGQGPPPLFRAMPERKKKNPYRSVPKDEQIWLKKWLIEYMFICQSVWLVYVNQSSKFSDFICSSIIGVWLSDFQLNIDKIVIGFSNHAVAEPIKMLYFQQIVLKIIVGKVKSEQLKVLQTKL